MQLINVLHGGTVFQHLLDEGKFIDHEQSHVEGFNSYRTPYHEVEIAKDSQLFKIVGEEKIKTNSSQRAALNFLGEIYLNLGKHLRLGKKSVPTYLVNFPLLMPKNLSILRHPNWHLLIQS